MFHINIIKRKFSVKKLSNPQLIDTYLVKHKFYRYFYENLIELHKSNGDERWRKNCTDVANYFLEEYVIDAAYNRNEQPIHPIKYYQVGEGYASIKTFPDDCLSNIYFWHEHLYPSSKYDKVRERIEYFKRMKTRG